MEVLGVSNGHNLNPFIFFCGIVAKSFKWRHLAYSVPVALEPSDCLLLGCDLNRSTQHMRYISLPESQILMSYVVVHLTDEPLKFDAFGGIVLMDVDFR